MEEDEGVMKMVNGLERGSLWSLRGKTQIYSQGPPNGNKWFYLTTNPFGNDTNNGPNNPRVLNGSRVIIVPISRRSQREIPQWVNGPEG